MSGVWPFDASAGSGLTSVVPLPTRSRRDAAALAETDDDFDLRDRSCGAFCSDCLRAISEPRQLDAALGRHAWTNGECEVAERQQLAAGELTSCCLLVEVDEIYGTVVG